MNYKTLTTILLFLNTVATGLNCTIAVIKSNSISPIVACVNTVAAMLMATQLSRILKEEKAKKEVEKLYVETARNILEELKEEQNKK